MDSQPTSGISYPVRIHLHIRTVGIELQDVGSILFLGSGVGIVDIRCRANRNEHLLTIGRELHIAGPVSIAAREGHDLLRWSACLQVSILIWKTDDRVRVRDI